MELSKKDSKIIKIRNEMEKLQRESDKYSNNNDKINKKVNMLIEYLDKETNKNDLPKSILNKIEHQKDKLSKIKI